ncbi:MAG: aldo/keto reductase [Chloroflexota bacterium]|nr:aldo/keto reductase [Chloroflexota bacterium]
MQYRYLGETGLKVSNVGFGAIKLPEVSEEQAYETLNYALDQGINFIDTARNYSDSEHKIGLVLKERRDDCYVATKTHSRDADGAMRDLETSLRELQTDRLDIWQLHNVMNWDLWQQVTRPDGALVAAKRAREEGMVDHLGISIHRSLRVMREAIRSGEFETILLLYNPLDEEGVKSNGILDLAEEHGMGVIIMKALSGGALTLHLNDEERDEKHRASNGEWFDPVVRGSIRHVLSQPQVDVVIPGMRCVREVRENLPVSDMPPMTDEEEQELVRDIADLQKTYKYEQDCLRCGYCTLVCPQNILIPEAFRAEYVYRQYPEDTRDMGLEIYESLEVSPSECIGCEDCMEECPAGIPIPERLEQVVALFEGIK